MKRASISLVTATSVTEKFAGKEIVLRAVLILEHQGSAAAFLYRAVRHA
jgi:hypothetical protein